MGLLCMIQNKKRKETHLGPPSINLIMNIGLYLPVAAIIYSTVIPVVTASKVPASKNIGSTSIPCKVTVN
ncbi:hypothetical protein UFOVP782_30 [uncultured Caudovirales phage]|uniref:Uncharacterized protein n=1 Tax=uncultured Caudovirales phage TaxID=2100421 RepID=A0A6J5NSI9_9CAUD|nr:hypothetical protein UFOVP782_30 [uncultured Caudovirales phage]